MKKSPVYPKYETNDYNGDEYNPHAAFSLVLEEAKQNERIKTDYVISPARPEEEEEDVFKTKLEQEKNKKKKKKPWKAFLLPWWKSEKKNDKRQLEPVATNMRRGFMSGPVYGSSGKSADGRPRRPVSGPLMSSLFNPIKKADTEIPYVCLDQLGGPCPAKNYGPVYLVT